MSRSRSSGEGSRYGCATSRGRADGENHSGLDFRGTEAEYTDHMDYSVGSRIRVRLYSGKVVEAELTAITNQSSGGKIQIHFGSVTASINPGQIIEILR